MDLGVVGSNPIIHPILKWDSPAVSYGEVSPLAENRRERHRFKRARPATEEQSECEAGEEESHHPPRN